MIFDTGKDVILSFPCIKSNGIFEMLSSSSSSPMFYELNKEISREENEEDDAGQIMSPLKVNYPSENGEIDRQVDELLKEGFIRESKSPVAFPVVPVRKPDGSLRVQFPQ